MSVCMFTKQGGVVVYRCMYICVCVCVCVCVYIIAGHNEVVPGEQRSQFSLSLPASRGWV